MGSTRVQPIVVFMAERCNCRLLTRNLIFDFIGHILHLNQIPERVVHQVQPFRGIFMSAQNLLL